jgi:HTH-type transcriptional regulator, sugar sensing transcriptional regulator
MTEKLIAIGFSEYEAKAYLALVRESPATAYEIAKASGIPTSKIYEVLNKLLERKAVLKIEHSRKQKYLPLSPDELIAQYRLRVEDTLSGLQKGLHEVQRDQNLSYIWNILDHDTLMEKAIQLIANAHKQALLSVWQEEMQHVGGEIKSALKRGVKVATVLFGRHKNTFGQSFPHPIEDTLYAEKGGRGLVIVADSQEVLFGKIAAGNKVEGAYSRNTGFVAMAEDYVKHDIYVMKIVQRFDPLLEKTFGKNYRKLRDVFHNEEEAS